MQDSNPLELYESRNLVCIKLDQLGETFSIKGALPSVSVELTLNFHWGLRLHFLGLRTVSPEESLSNLHFFGIFC